MFEWKNNRFSELVKARASLVAKGFSQKEGMDNSFLESDLEYVYCDAEQAFVQFKLDAYIYIQIHYGCRDLSGKVTLLNESLYGL